MRNKFTQNPWTVFAVGFIFTALCISTASGRNDAFPPRPTNFIHDGAGLLSASCESDLDRFLRRVQRECNTEFLVITVNRLPAHATRSFVSSRNLNVSIEDFAQAMFNQYEVGQRSTNRGVLLLISKHDRRCRIELGAGYSSRVDAIAKRVVDSTLVPAFRGAQYERGIQAGVEEIATSIIGLRIESQAHPSSAAWLWISLAAFATTVVTLGGSLLINKKRGWGWVIVGICYIQYLTIRNWLHRPSATAGRSTIGSGGSRSFGSDGWSCDGGSFSGGGDFSSGGFSDGGGASGSW